MRSIGEGTDHADEKPEIVAELEQLVQAAWHAP